MLMGVLPAIARMPLATYAGAWQAMDHYMAVRMPALVNITLVLYLIAILSFVRERRGGSSGRCWAALPSL